VIDFLRRRDYARQLLEDWSSAGFLAVSTLTHLEIYHGMRPVEETSTNSFLDGLTSIPVDISIARLAGRMLGGLRTRGTTIGIADSVIAATALQYGIPLLTNNMAHYPFTGLKLVRGMES
jgi:predicted nucleic acid-binding protein